MAGSPGPFDIINAVTDTKVRLITADNEKNYKPFVVNRGLSNNSDCLMFAQDMNEMHHLDPLLQHDYYFYGLRKKKRWGKWNKKRDDRILELCEHLKKPRRLVVDMIRVMGQEEFDQLVDEMDRAKN